MVLTPFISHLAQFSISRLSFSLIFNLLNLINREMETRNMNLKELVNKTNAKNKDIEDKYGYIFNEYEMWIVDRYLKAINETKETEDYLRRVLYSFLTLRDTFKN